MLTRRGWFFVGGTVAFIAGGRLFGISELYLMATAGAALVGCAVVFVRLTPFRLQATRQLHPPRVHAGGASRVDLVVQNGGTRRSPVLTVRDPFDGGRRWARFLLSPLARGESARAAYRLPTDRRGVFQLGPLEVQLGDPFGLARASLVAADPIKLTVYPRVDPIGPLPTTLGNDPHAGADHPTALGRTGEDFYALRPYVTGDDLRRVHWPSTAKLDDLMIRQDEMPWQGRATVVLDLRTAVHSAESLEIAVSAAASIVSASWSHRALVRLATSHGVDTGFAAGYAHVEAILEHLATATFDHQGNLLPLLASLRREGNGGALAIVTTAAVTGAELEAVTRLRNRFGAVTVVLLERSIVDPATRQRQPPRAVPKGLSLVRVTPETPFADAWDRAMRPIRARAN